eukprot:5319360-Alexandrium_andersonii.AAC.1
MRAKVPHAVGDRKDRPKSLDPVALQTRSQGGRRRHAETLLVGDSAPQLLKEAHRVLNRRNMFAKGDMLFLLAQQPSPHHDVIGQKPKIGVRMSGLH